MSEALRIIKDLDVLELRHIKGGFAIVTGIKKDEPVPKGAVCGGNGTYGVTSKSLLVLVGEKDDHIISAEIDIQVRQKLNRRNINADLVQKLQQSIPEKIDLEECLRRNGVETYLKVTDACMDAWLRRI